MIIMQIVKLRFNIYFNFCCGRTALSLRALCVFIFFRTVSPCLCLSFFCLSVCTLSSALSSLSFLSFFSNLLCCFLFFMSYLHSMRDQQRYQCWMKTVFLLGEWNENCGSYYWWSAKETVDVHTEKSKCNNNPWKQSHGRMVQHTHRSRTNAGARTSINVK